MKVLGIETSCDDTAVAVYDTGAGLVAHLLRSQAALHAPHGGVVPEIASRDHIRVLLPLVEQTLAEAGLSPQALDGVGYTAGPGLVGALLVGAGFARSFAYGLGIPALPVHHLEGHLLAPLLEADPPSFPFLALLVSGGHTMLVDVEGLGRYRVLGQSLDDAAGEAFDKTAKLLGLGYPGGPAVAAAARAGDPARFRFPRPMVDRPGLDFSFSGLKTFVANTVRAAADADPGPGARRGGAGCPPRLDAALVADVARAFQDAVVDTLRIKVERALAGSGRGRLVVAGGVGANRALRACLEEVCAVRGVRVHFPRIEFCTDNGAMIALAAGLRLDAMRRGRGQGGNGARPAAPAGPGGSDSPPEAGGQGLGFAVRPRWDLETLAPPA